MSNLELWSKLMDSVNIDDLSSFVVLDSFNVERSSIRSLSVVILLWFVNTVVVGNGSG